MTDEREIAERERHIARMILQLARMNDRVSDNQCEYLMKNMATIANDSEVYTTIKNIFYYFK